jgi:glycine dehydrogenase
MKDLSNSKEFIGRHIGPSEEHIKTMLSYLNIPSLDELIQKIVPDKILEKEELKLEESISEDKALKFQKKIKFIKTI